MRFTKRLLCLLLAVMLVFSVPLGAMAEASPEATETAEVTEATILENAEATEEATAFHRGTSGRFHRGNGGPSGGHHGRIGR